MHSRARGLPRAYVAGGLIAFVAALHVALALRTHGPIVQGDEMAYVENARFLALGGARPANTYYPGVSVLLAPLWWVTRNPVAVWRGAQALNIAAAVGTMLGAAVLGGMCGLSPRQRWVVALAVSLYPPVLLYTDFSLAESVFQAMFMAVVVLTVVAAKRTMRDQRAVWLWLAVGLLAGGLATVHPRGYAVDVAVVLLGLVVLRPIRRHAAEAVAVGCGLVFSLGWLRVLTVATRASNVGGRPDYQASSLLERNFGFSGTGKMLLGAAGRVLYQSVATIGLMPFGVAVGAIAVIELLRRRVGPSSLPRAFVAVCAVGVAAFTLLLGGTRPDQLIQGRYTDGVVAPVLVVALAALIVERRWRTYAVVGVGVTIASAAAFAALRGHTDRGQPLNPANILGVEPLVRWAGGHVSALELAAAGIAAIAVLAVTARRSLPVALGLVSAAFLVSAVSTQVSYIGPGSLAKASQTVLVDTIQRASKVLDVPRQCVSYDTDEDFAFFNDRFHLGTQALELLEPGQKPCGAFVISGLPDFTTRYPQARMVVGESGVPEQLYVLPGTTERLLQSHGWLLPPDTPGPLPSAAREAQIAVTANAALHSGATRTITAAVTNAGHSSVWPAEITLGTPTYAVRVSVRWFTLTGVRPVRTTDVDLAKSLLPGERLTLKIPLIARVERGGAPLAHGLYRVTVDVEQEGVGFFTGEQTILVSVT